MDDYLLENVQETRDPMLVERLLVIILLVPIGVGLIALGGWGFAIAVTLILGAAAWEYANLFKKAGSSPATALLVGGVVALVLARKAYGFIGAGAILAGLTLIAMAYHLVTYERGCDTAALDFGVTLGGILYLGWLGAYLISLRELPDGKWWMLVALPAVWAADAGAYVIGSNLGRHKMSPRLSPGKTWEGYAGGILSGILGGALIAGLWSPMAPSIQWFHGAILGLTLSVITPLGDLGESMFKRHAGVKDSSHVIPGHGGIFDRIDSWLWAGVLSYYWIVLFVR